MLPLSMRQRWMLLFRGVVAVLFGALALLAPEFTLLFLVVLGAAYALTGGLSSLLSAFLAPGAEARQRWLLGLEGCLGVAVGSLTLLWPTLPATASVALLAGWILLGGILLFAPLLEWRPSSRTAFLLALVGLTAFVLGGLLLFFPRVGIVTLAWCAGLYALLSGAVFLVLAFRLHRQMKPSGYQSVPEEAHERIRQEAIQAQGSSEPQPLGKHASGRSERDAKPL